MSIHGAFAQLANTDVVCPPSVEMQLALSK